MFAILLATTEPPTGQAFISASPFTIAAARPEFVDRNSVPADRVEKEMEILMTGRCH